MSELKTKKYRIWLIPAAILVLLNVIAFAAPFTRNAAFWISYGFTMLAVLVQIYVFTVAFKGTDTIKSKLYGVPIARVGIIYLLVQFVCGVAVMALDTVVPAWAALLAYVVFLVFAVIGFVAADISRAVVEQADVKLAEKTGRMRELRAKVSVLPNLTNDAALKSELAKLSEAFRFSDPVSDPALDEVESRLAGCVDELRSALESGDSDAEMAGIRKTKAVLNERNVLCKAGKNRV